MVSHIRGVLSPSGRFYEDVVTATISILVKYNKIYLKNI